jgi:hypothetical protein
LVTPFLVIGLICIYIYIYSQEFDFFLLKISLRVFVCWRSMYGYFFVGDQRTSIFFVGDQCMSIFLLEISVRVFLFGWRSMYKYFIACHKNLLFI